MRSVLLISQILVSIALTVAILVQVKGVGLGRVWGGAGSFSRRGLEKVIFKASFVLAFLFIVISVLLIFVR